MDPNQIEDRLADAGALIRSDPEAALRELAEIAESLRSLGAEPELHRLLAMARVRAIESLVALGHRWKAIEGVDAVMTDASALANERVRGILKGAVVAGGVAVDQVAHDVSVGFAARDDLVEALSRQSGWYLALHQLSDQLRVLERVAAIEKEGLSCDSRSTVARASFDRGIVLRDLGCGREAISVWEELASRADGAEPKTAIFVAKGMQAAAEVFLDLVNWRAAARAAGQAVELATAAGDERLRADALATQRYSLAQAGDLPGASVVNRAIIDSYGAASDTALRERVDDALLHDVWAQLELRNFDSAVERAECLERRFAEELHLAAAATTGEKVLSAATYLASSGSLSRWSRRQGTKQALRGRADELVQAVLRRAESSENRALGDALATSAKACMAEILVIEGRLIEGLRTYESTLSLTPDQMDDAEKLAADARASGSPSRAAGLTIAIAASLAERGDSAQAAQVLEGLAAEMRAAGGPRARVSAAAVSAAQHWIARVT